MMTLQRWKRSCGSAFILASCVLATTGIAIAESLPASGPPTASRDSVTISVSPDHADGVYKTAETATFTIRLTRDGKPVENADINLRTETIGAGKIDAKPSTLQLKNGEATATATFPADGTLVILQASYSPDGGKPVTMEAGAVAAPQTLKPGLPPPDDFDAFWAAQRKLLANEPVKPQLTPVDAPKSVPADKVECFDVQINCPGGAPVSGYFARPKNARPKSLPAIITFHGAGVRSAKLEGPAFTAVSGKLAMDINAHGIPNGKPDDFYANLAQGELKDYPHRGLGSRDTCYFRGMYLRLLRAMDFLASQPEWDGRVLVVMGYSQGGGQSLAAAALDPRVTLVSIGVPALCDLAGQEAGRPNGWPIYKKLDQKEHETLRYFDGANFATRIHAATSVRIGLADRTCYATTSLAMFNQLQGKKFLVISPTATHMFTPPGAYKPADDFHRKAFAEQIAAEPK
jgi:cephalosporin-C deacetylase-like acetyl esterase